MIGGPTTCVPKLAASAAISAGARPATCRNSGLDAAGGENHQHPYRPVTAVAPGMMRAGRNDHRGPGGRVDRLAVEQECQRALEHVE